MITVARRAERIVVEVPTTPAQDQTVELAFTREGALDLIRALASALGREDIVNRCHKEKADG